MLDETTNISLLLKEQLEEIRKQNELYETNIIKIEKKTEECQKLKNEEIKKNDLILIEIDLKKKDLEIQKKQSKQITELIIQTTCVLEHIYEFIKYLKNGPTERGIVIILDFLQNINIPILLQILNVTNSTMNNNDKDKLIEMMNDTVKKIGNINNEIKIGSEFNIEGNFQSEDFQFVGKNKTHIN